MKAAGLRVLVTDAVGHYLPVPRRPPVELPWLNNPRFMMCWLGLGTRFILAEKP